MIPRDKPPLECELCGMPRWNDDTVIWMTPTYGDDRKPYCADECADQAVRIGDAS